MNPCNIEDAVDWPKHFTLVCHISFVLHRCLVNRKCLVTLRLIHLYFDVMHFFSDPICNPFRLIYSVFSDRAHILLSAMLGLHMKQL